MIWTSTCPHNNIFLLCIVSCGSCHLRYRLASDPSQWSVTPPEHIHSPYHHIYLSTQDSLLAWHHGKFLKLSINITYLGQNFEFWKKPIKNWLSSMHGWHLYDGTGYFCNGAKVTNSKIHRFYLNTSRLFIKLCLYHHEHIQREKKIKEIIE